VPCTALESAGVDVAKEATAENASSVYERFGFGALRMTLRSMMATLAALRWPVTNNTHYERQFRRYRQPVPSDKLDIARARVLKLSPVAPPEETIEAIKAIGNAYRLSKEAVGGLVEDFLDFHDIDPEAPPAVAELRSGYRVLGSGNDGEILDDLVNAIIGETLETLNASPPGNWDGILECLGRTAKRRPFSMPVPPPKALTAPGPALGSTGEGRTAIPHPPDARRPVPLLVAAHRCRQDRQRGGPPPRDPRRLRRGRGPSHRPA
jgi:hypothetical protein